MHLVDGGVLRRSAAIGLPAQLLAATATVPVGDAGGMIGRAASSGEVVIVDDIRVGHVVAPSWGASVSAARGRRRSSAAAACSAPSPATAT